VHVSLCVSVWGLFITSRRD